MIKNYDRIYDSAADAYRKETFTIDQTSGKSAWNPSKGEWEQRGAETLAFHATRQGFSILCVVEEGELFMVSWTHSDPYQSQAGSGRVHLPKSTKLGQRPGNFHVDRDPARSGQYLAPLLVVGLALNMLTVDNVPLNGETFHKRLNDFTVGLHRGYPVKDAVIYALKTHPTPYTKNPPKTPKTKESTTMTNPIETAVSNERNTTDAYSLNSRKAALLMMSGYTTCLVCYDLQPLERMTTPPKLFTFLTPVELNLAKGDIIVVPAKEGFDLARVVHVDDLPQLNLDRADIYKWVVSKVDFGAYNELVKRDEEIARAVAQAEQTRMREQLKASLGDLIGPEALTAVKAALNITDETGGDGQG